MNATSQETLLQHLQEFGLEPREAQIYLTLVTRGPSKAGTIASQSGLARVDTYRTLKRLMERGIVQATLHRPMKFVVAPLDQGLEALVEAHRSLALRLEKRKDELLSLLAPAQPPPIEREGERFTVLKGRSQFFVSLRSLLARARATVGIKTTKNGVIRLYNATLDEEFERAASRGVKVRLLCPVDASYTEILQRFATFAKIHHSEDIGSGQFVVTDAAEALVSTFLDDSLRLKTPTDTSLWTNSQGFATSTQTFFDELWSKSSEYEAILTAKLTGKPIPTLQVIKEVAEIRSKVEEILSGTSKRIEAIAGELGTTWFLQPEILSLLSDLKGRQVGIRLLIQETESNLRVAVHVCEQFEVKHFEAEFDGVFLLADDALVLAIEIPEEEPKPLPKTAFFTNEANFTHSLKLLFNQLWGTAQSGAYRVGALQAEERSRALVAACSDFLSDRGYVVATPGKIKGKLEVEHTFSIVAQKQNDPEKTITLDVLVDPTPVESTKVVFACAKRSDITSWRSFLLVEPGVQPVARDLTEFYGVELIEGRNSREVLDKFRRALKESPTTRHIQAKA